MMVDLSYYFDAHKSEFPVNISKLVRDAGVELIENAVLDSDIAGQVARNESDDTFTISISDKLSDNWKRYVTAHELGHYILHQSKIGSGVDDNTAFFSKPGGNFNNPKIGEKEELEAHHFAALILMPKEKFAEYFSNFNSDNENQVMPEDYFKVPDSVISWWMDKVSVDDGLENESS